jgi:CHAT domain
VVSISSNRQPLRFPAEKLAMNLIGTGVRLAVLGACDAGRYNHLHTWTGVVPALISKGIPAVMSMQYSIRHDNVFYFFQRFYRTLAEGQPIDVAMINGRLAIYTKSADDNERDWGVPVLYMRASEGVLFPKVAVLVPQNVSQYSRPSNIMRVSLPAAITTTSPKPGETRMGRPIDQITLREAITAAFNLEELKQLCADIEGALAKDEIREQINLESIGPNDSGKAGKVLQLIEYLDRRGYLDYLIVAVRQQRPNIQF